MGEGMGKAGIIKIIFGIITIAILIAGIIFCVKIKKNSKDEPTDRDKYLINDKLDYYEKGDFCENHRNTFIEVGALKDFDINMKKIHRFSNGLLWTYIISLILTVLSLGLTFCLDPNYCIICVLEIVRTLNSILNIVFLILLGIYYGKSQFGHFDEFSKCLYLNNLYNKDYDFVYVVKKNYHKLLILTIIMAVFSLLQSLISFICK